MPPKPGAIDDLGIGAQNRLNLIQDMILRLTAKVDAFEREINGLKKSAGFSGQDQLDFLERELATLSKSLEFLIKRMTFYIARLGKSLKGRLYLAVTTLCSLRLYPRHDLWMTKNPSPSLVKIIERKGNFFFVLRPIGAIVGDVGVTTSGTIFIHSSLITTPVEEGVQFVSTNNFKQVASPRLVLNGNLFKPR